jgi:hypothetical protein
VSARRAPTGGRTPALLGVLAVVAALVAASHAGHGFAPSVRVATAPVAGPTLPPVAAISSSWFCAEGTAVAGGRADETVIVANLGGRSVTATIAVTSGDRPVASQRFSVAAAAQLRVDVASLTSAAEPGVVVEVLGGPVVVEHEVRHGARAAVGPCARQASSDWYFAAGATGPGTEDWLALFNPFGDDAIVDVTFLTASGVQAPGQTQAIDVPRRSRVSLPLHQLVPDQSSLALHVHARTGRVAAEQSLIFDGTNGVTGIATTLGATGTSATWRVPTGDAETGTTATLVLANFGPAGTRVDVHLALDSRATLPTMHVAVPSMSVETLPLSAIPTGGGYAVTLSTPRARPVVAQLLEVWAPPAPIVGVTATLGSTATAARWAFATGRVTAAGDAQLVAFNPSRRTRTVRVLAGAAGGLGRIATATVAPGQRVVVPLAAGVGPNQVLVLSADGPVAAGRLVLGPSPSASSGVPALP